MIGKWTMSWVPQVGEEVRIVHNESLAGKMVDGKHALLVPGDTIIIHTVLIDEKEVSYLFDEGRYENFLFFSEIAPLSAKTTKKDCDCDIMVLMRAGCQCGFLKKE